MRLLFLVVFLVVHCMHADADDLIGFPREDFGKIVLSDKQSFTDKLEGSVGNYNNEPISLYNKRSLFARLGRPVGRLDILTNIRTFPCTGFLISQKYLLTNYHCVPGILELDAVRERGATRIEGVQIVLGYIREGIEEDAKRFQVLPTPVEKNKDLDYAILEVIGNPSKQFGMVKLSSAAPYDNQPFLIIGHPLGSSQRISREKCASASPAVSSGRVRHKCDTLPGNSGSPVFDQDTASVIALHHAGSSRNSINYAIPLARIVEKSPLLQKLTKPAEKVEKPQTPDQSPAFAAMKKKLAALEAELQKRREPPKKEEPKVAVGIYPETPKAAKRLPFEPEMISIPGGTFKMGCLSGKGCYDAEKPIRSVTVAPFEIGKYEVTVGEYMACVKDGKCRAPEWKEVGNKYNIDTGSDDHYKKLGRALTGKRHPIVGVSWDDATAYADWLSKKTNEYYQLPTEAEWEYAARAGTQTQFFFGNRESDLCKYVNGADKSTNYSWANKKCSDGVARKTAKVGRYKKNAFGLYDMHGNVSEWTQDCWHKSYNKGPSDGSAWLKEDAGDCSKRVLRGGSWSDGPRYLRSSVRYGTFQDSRSYGNGFRLSRKLAPSDTSKPSTSKASNLYPYTAVLTKATDLKTTTGVFGSTVYKLDVGDTLTIIGEVEGEYWYRAKDRSGLVGVIRKDAVKKLN